MQDIPFKLGTELTFKSVIPLRKKLCKILMNEPSTHLCLDLSEVTHCDSAGIALLVDLRRMCKKNNKILEMIGMSLKTQSLADFCGVKDIL